MRNSWQWRGRARAKLCRLLGKRQCLCLTSSSSRKTHWSQRWELWGNLWCRLVPRFQKLCFRCYLGKRGKDSSTCWKSLRSKMSRTPTNITALFSRVAVRPFWTPSKMNLRRLSLMSLISTWWRRSYSDPSCWWSTSLKSRRKLKRTYKLL
jgi:hypothetical protein